MGVGVGNFGKVAVGVRHFTSDFPTLDETVNTIIKLSKEQSYSHLNVQALAPGVCNRNGSQYGAVRTKKDGDIFKRCYVQLTNSCVKKFQFCHFSWEFLNNYQRRYVVQEIC